MARYNLIIRDQTYVKLLEYAVRKNKSLGKVLNEVLDGFAKNLQADGHVPAQAVCIVCGRKANFEMYGKGQQKLFVCTIHKSNFDRFVDNYKHLEV